MRRLLISLAMLAWFSAMAYASDVHSTGYLQADPSRMEWVIIAGLLGVVQILVGFIYINGMGEMRKAQEELKSTIRELFSKLDRKMDIQHHETLCEARIHKDGEGG